MNNTSMNYYHFVNRVFNLAGNYLSVTILSEGENQIISHFFQ